jgi:preprotein translocase SecE subunit
MATTKEHKKNSLVTYFEDSYQEIRKVAWPTRNQAVRLTFLVLGFMIVMALMIGVLDYVFGTGHRALLNLSPAGSLPATVQDAQMAPVTTTTSTTGDSSNGGVSVGDVSTSTGNEQPVEIQPIDGSSSHSSVPADATAPTDAAAPTATDTPSS